MTQESLFTALEEYPEEEGVILYSSGKIRLWWHEAPSEEAIAADPEAPDVKVEYQLRLPRFREYRRFREGINEMQMDGTEDEQREAIVDWTKDAVKTLDKRRRSLPEDSEGWPLWLTMGLVQSYMLNHWTTTPLAHGVKGEATQTPEASTLKAV